jgi:hypothetical protein
MQRDEERGRTVFCEAFGFLQARSDKSIARAMDRRQQPSLGGSLHRQLKFDTTIDSNVAKGFK